MARQLTLEGYPMRYFSCRRHLHVESYVRRTSFAVRAKLAPLTPPPTLETRNSVVVSSLNPFLPVLSLYEAPMRQAHVTM